MTDKYLKRPRGGQPGNQNARKHGFYSRKLTPEEICRFWNITNLEAVEPEIAAFRIKLHSVLQLDPDNRRVLKEAVKVLAKWYQSKDTMSKEETKIFKKVVWASIEANFARSLSPSGDLSGLKISRNEAGLSGLHNMKQPSAVTHEKAG